MNKELIITLSNDRVITKKSGEWDNFYPEDGFVIVRNQDKLVGMININNVVSIEIV